MAGRARGWRWPGPDRRATTAQRRVPSLSRHWAARGGHQRPHLALPAPMHITMAAQGADPAMPWALSNRKGPNRPLRKHRKAGTQLGRPSSDATALPIQEMTDLSEVLAVPRSCKRVAVGSSSAGRADTQNPGMTQDSRSKGNTRKASHAHRRRASCDRLRQSARFGHAADSRRATADARCHKRRQTKRLVVSAPSAQHDCGESLFGDRKRAGH